MHPLFLDKHLNMPGLIAMWELDHEYLLMKAEEVNAYVTAKISELDQLDILAVAQLKIACLFLYKEGKIVTGPATESMGGFLCAWGVAILGALLRPHSDCVNYLTKIKEVHY